MKTFAITIATIAGLLTHQAIAADTMIDIECEDNSHFKLEETSSDAISKCVNLPGKPIAGLSVRNPYTCYLFVNDHCGGNVNGNGKDRKDDWDYLQFRGRPSGSYGMLKGLQFRAVRCDKS